MLTGWRPRTRGRFTRPITVERRGRLPTIGPSRASPPTIVRVGAAPLRPSGAHVARASDRGHDPRMRTSTKLTFIICSLGLALGGCARTSADRARSEAPGEREPETVDPVIDSVGNSEHLKPTPGADQPAPETQDIGNPGSRVDERNLQDQPDRPDVANVPDDTTGPNRKNPGVPPPSGN